jgi:hypothetical protein
MKRIRYSAMRPLASALALTFVSGALSAMSFAAMPALDAGRMLSASFAAQTGDSSQPSNGFVKEDGPARQGHGPRYTPEDANGRARYIVILREAPVATYKGETQGYAAIPKRASSVSGTVRKDIDSAQAKSYASHLQSQQRSFTDSLTSKLGRAVSPAAQFQYALNAVALDLTADEAEALRQDPDVHLVNREQIREPKTFDTPRLINATGVWNGTDTLGGVTSKGEGMVVGVIDTGINWMSHSFLATGSDGFTVVNPLGDGNYLGACKTGGADVGHCNSKLIGIYNFITSTASGQDLDGHGSHTASTAAGNNYTTAPFAGGIFNVSGIAPHANVIAYKGCCTDTGLTQSLNQAIIDKVDTLNFSIGGTGGDSLASPWTDTGELAFLSLQDAGVFVAAAAGNDGPSDNSFDHASPWVTTVGATTPAMIAAFSFSLSGGPANTQNLAAIPGSAPLPTQAYLNLPLIESPNFADGSNDGCSAYPANYFRRGQTASGAQGIAVLRLDQNASNCGSGSRRTNAVNAGAIAVVYVDPEFVNLGATGASYSLLKEGWDAIKASGADVTPTGTATATIGFPVSPASRPGDRMAGFSSRGPSPFATLKPDISAPGDTILAAMSPTAASGYTTANQAATSDIYKNDSGTSMATPHITGAATLVRALHRDWTPMQVKSALMTTANRTVYNETGSALTTANTVGAGRVDVGAATRAGLLFDETHANFIAANPANGGKPETLNIASLYHFGCTATCVFPRTVSSALNVSGNWTITVNGLAAGSYSLDKTSFSLANKGDTSSFTLSIDSTKLGAATGAWVYGELLLTPNVPTVSVQRLPIAILPTAARLTSSVNSFAVKVGAGKTTTKPITISNTGNPTLNWSFSTTTLGGTILTRAPGTSGLQVVTVGSGTAITSTSNSNRYIGDYFDLAAPANVTRLQANAFTDSSSATLTDLATQVAWRIYADSGSNVPAGRPGITTPAEQPTFLFNSAANTPTATKTRFDGQISVDLIGAGAAPPVQTAGRYWMMMTPTISTAASGSRWYWLFNTDATKTVAAQVVTGNAAGRAYASVGANRGMAMRVDINATCSAPWLGYGSTSGALGAGASSGPVAVTFDATSLSAGVYKAYVCLSGNGTSPPSFVDSVNTDSILIPTTLRVSSCTATPNPTDSTATVTITCLGVEPGTTNTIPGATCSAVTADASGGKIVCTGTAGNIGNDPTWTSTNTATNDVFTSVVPLTFPIYTVTTTLSGTGGTISAPAQSPLVPGGSTTFTVSALTGYSIAAVTGDTCTPSVQSGDTYTTGPVNANCTITASFTANAVNGVCGADNGQTLTVAPTNLCSAGTASAVTGSGPWSWTCSGSNGSTNASCSANIQTWTVTTALGGAGGSISAPAQSPVNHGSSTTFTVSANPGYSIGSVVGDTCTPTVQSGSTYSTGAITANCSITASFNHQAGYTALNPSRILDTRAIGTTSDGQFAAIGAINGGQFIDLTVLGRGGVPASAVKAVVLNVTATGASAATYVTAWPTGSTRPLASNINVFPGQNSPNLVIVQVGTGGKVSLFNALGSTDLIADVQGYFTDTSDLTPLVPGRLLDTRSIGVTVDGTFQKLGPVPGLSKLDLTVAGRYGIPASGVGSVILNVTATGPASSGYVVVWPAGTRVPATSNLNFVAGQTIPNLVITQVGSNGKVSLFSSADTDLIADVMGWFPTSSDLTTLAPARLLDTRGIGVTTDGQFAGGGAIAGGSRLDLVVTGRGNVPATGVNAVVLNITATGPNASGFLTAWPTGSTRPLASNLNFVAGQTVPNLVIVKVGDLGKVSLFNSAGNTDVVVDVVGWFAAASPP